MGDTTLVVAAPTHAMCRFANDRIDTRRVGHYGRQQDSRLDTTAPLMY